MYVETESRSVTIETEFYSLEDLTLEELKAVVVALNTSPSIAGNKVYQSLLDYCELRGINPFDDS